MQTILTDYDRRRSEEARKIADMVAVTLGPYGHNVDVQPEKGSASMLRDGFKILQEFRPAPSVQSLVLARMREAAYRTSVTAGDSTTTTTILLAKIYEYVVSSMQEADKSTAVSRREIARAIRVTGRHICDWLEQHSIADIDPNTEHGFQILRRAITLAGGNSQEIGDTFASLLREVGVDGQIIQDVSPEYEGISWELRPGYRVQAGLITNHMLPKGMNRVELHEPFVMLVKSAIHNLKELKPLIKRWQEHCEEQGAVVPWLILFNAMQSDGRTTFLDRINDKGQAMPWYGVQVPGDPVVWDDLEAIMGIEAAGSGRTHMHAKQGQYTTTVPRVVLSMLETIINVEPEHLEESGLIERIEASAKDMNSEQQEAAKQRIARLQGKVGVIKVPATTTARMRWTAEVLMDAYKTGVSTLKYGVRPGGGVTLIKAGKAVDKARLSDVSYSYDIGAIAVIEAMSAITQQLLRNGGVPKTTENFIVGAFKDVDGAENSETINLTAEVLPALLSDDVNTILNAKIVVDPIDSGVLDSTKALMDAVEAACEEAADWVETSIALVPDAYLREELQLP